MENFKYKKFLENANLLNREYKMIPLLYGSVGLAEAASYYLNSDDIDILIPEEYLSEENWPKFVEFLASHGYVLTDEHEHLFVKDDIKYAYASIEALKDFAGIDPRDIAIYENSVARYKLLSLEQYLKVYEKSLEDEYRVNVFKKKEQDEEKISFIKSRL